MALGPHAAARQVDIAERLEHLERIVAAAATAGAWATTPVLLAALRASIAAIDAERALLDPLTGQATPAP